MAIPPPKLSTTLSDTYDKAFFDHHTQHRATYEHFASLIRALSPAQASSVVDVGCGHCLLLDALRHHFTSATGIDGSDAGIPSHLRDYVSLRDLTTAGWRGEAPLTTDVVVTLETAEHLPERCARAFVSELTRGRPSVVFFSAATPYQDCGQNPTHINEQPLSYWIEIFEQDGYHLAVDQTITMRTKMIESGLYGALAWYPKNILVFSRDETTEKELAPPPRIISSNPVFQLIFDRDRLEFETILLRRTPRGR